MPRLAFLSQRRTPLRLTTGIMLALPFALAHATDAIGDTDDASAQTSVARKHATTLKGIAVNGSYTEQASTATKLDMPVLETPQAISVVPRELLDAQRALHLSEALRNVAGVSQATVYGFFDGFNLRGFNASSGATYLDGLLASDDMANYELSGLQRLEVVKGPASGLYGQGPLSGLVNMVSKRPQDERFADVGLSVGTNRFHEGRVDANSPLNASGSLLGRVNLLYREQNFFVDSSDMQRVYIAPSLTWKVDADTTLTLLGGYQRDLIHPWSPITAYGTILPNPNGTIPVNRTINDRDYPAVQHRSYKTSGYQFDHRFNDTFSLHQGLRYEDFHNSWDHWLFASGMHDDLRTIDRFYYGPFDERGHDLRVDTNLSAAFDTGNVEHYVLLGADYGTRTARSVNNFDPGPYPLDIFDPVYGTTPGPDLYDPQRALQKNRQRGIYLQDHLRFGLRVTLTLGGRWDHASSSYNGDIATDNAFSPHAGLTLALSEATVLYANYSRSFNPQGSHQFFGGGGLPPERGVNLELGLKASRSDGSLTAMASLFQLTREDVATDDPAHPNFYLTTGQQRSRGLELETRWQPAAAFEFTAAYAYTKAEVTRDNVLPVGSRLEGIPRHNLNLWSRYNVTNGPLAGVGAGLGFNYQSRRPGSAYETLDPIYHRPIVFKSYALIDAALFYSHGDWETQLNVRNLFDRRYYVDGFSERITPGQPRSAMLTVQRHF
ncbi:TonB-dependent siderophore receptor [Rhodanobacter sp. Col0626]|uniref:TonB-dependent siderophore receptor n=1 Tax=Rhodanobacter sp. Col0626 TaxID=3415679 RepID=UPI003CF1EE00